MILTILGCGNSTGVPVINCKCTNCRSKNIKNKRLRASAWLQAGGKSILIDTSPDLRQQALKAKIPRIDAILYTHPHADHTHGIDDLRVFNFSQREPIPAYGNAWTCQELKSKFPYVFSNLPAEGGGLPQLDLHCFETSEAELHIAGQSIIPLSLLHGSKECVGYRFGPMAYVTDCSYIPPSTLERLKGLSVLILDCLRLDPHPTHLNLDRALEIVSILKPKKTYLTHLGHEIGYHPKWLKVLPKGVTFAYDGLILRIK